MEKQHELYKAFMRLEAIQVEINNMGFDMFHILKESQSMGFDAIDVTISSVALSLRESYDDWQNSLGENDE